MATKYIVTAKGASVNHPTRGYPVYMPQGSIFYGDQYSSMAGVEVYAGADPATFDFSGGGITSISFTVDSGQSLSGAIALYSGTVLGVVNPAALEATTALWLVFGCPTVDGTYQQVVAYDDTAITLGALAGKNCPVQAIASFAAWSFIKLQAATDAGSPVAQTAERVGSLQVARFIG